MRRARQLLRRLDVVQLDDDLLLDASTLAPGVLRSLDAIHLAAARVFGEDLESVVTYDDRMAKAADQIGLVVDQPK